MSAAERKTWRAKWIARLMDAGMPFRDLAGITDHALWQAKNRHFGVGGVLVQKGLRAPQRSKYI